MTLAWKEPNRRPIRFSRATPLVIDDTVVHLTPAWNPRKGSALIVLSLQDGTHQNTTCPIAWSTKAHAWWPSPVKIGAYVFVTDLSGAVTVLKPGKPWTVESTIEARWPHELRPGCGGGCPALLYARQAGLRWSVVPDHHKSTHPSPRQVDAATMATPLVRPLTFP